MKFNGLIRFLYSIILATKISNFAYNFYQNIYIIQKKIVFLPDNLYYKALKPTIEAHEKGLPAVPKKQRAKAQKKPKKAKKRKEVDDVKNA